MVASPHPQKQVIPKGYDFPLNKALPAHLFSLFKLLESPYLHEESRLPNKLQILAQSQS